MNQLNIVQLIKKSKEEIQLSPVVLIYGYENLLKKQFIEKFKNKSRDFHFLWGDETTLKELKEIFSSGSLFSEGNEAVLWDVDSFYTNLSKEEKKEFTQFLQKISSPDRLILVSLKEKIPQKEPYKSIIKTATVINSPKLTPKAFEISVYKKIKNTGKDISQEDLKYLISKLPKDLYKTKQEIEKLLIYTYNKNTITKEDIDQIITTDLEINIFAFVDTFFKKDPQSIHLLKELIKQGSHPFEIQSLILTYANKLLLLKTFLEKKIPISEIFAKMGVSYRPQQTTLLNLSKNLSKDELIKLIKDLYQAEITQKVYYQEPQTQLENIVIQFCQED